MSHDQRISTASGSAGAAGGARGAGRGHGGSGSSGSSGSRLGGVVQGVLIAVGLIAMVGAFVLIAVQYRPYQVPTDSMQPTIHPGSTVLAHKVSGSAVGRGDVVVFNDPTWGTSNEVKRVIGVGGDTVACCDKQGYVTVNGKSIHEPYLSSAQAGGPLVGSGATSSFSAKVPAGRLFLLGDNRLVSLDSRSHIEQLSGTVPESDVLARVEGTVWPFSQFGSIDRTGAFDALPGRDATAHGPLTAAEYACVGGGALVLVTAALGSLAGGLRRMRRRSA